MHAYRLELEQGLNKDIPAGIALHSLVRQTPRGALAARKRQQLYFPAHQSPFQISIS